MKKTIVVLVLVMLFSCINNERNTPKNLMTEDQMVDFLLDINIINSSRAFRNKSELNYYNIKDSLLFKKHKIDSTIFSESNFYYASNPKLYLNIYSKLETKLKSLKDSLSKDLEEKTKIRNDSLKKIN
ncbi:MAG: hypothetical protein CMC38_02840 [Flavobacteriaceae bacterium]|nr:hypothetical protein [Flavobacteriaceae bacterium]|tara:strand:- start:7206 stop:7589 length:384 start_codon:yes stop_codon:yes gene_type:complete